MGSVETGTRDVLLPFETTELGASSYLWSFVFTQTLNTATDLYIHLECRSAGPRAGFIYIVRLPLLCRSFSAVPGSRDFQKDNPETNDKAYSRDSLHTGVGATRAPSLQLSSYELSSHGPASGVSGQRMNPSSSDA